MLQAAADLACLEILDLDPDAEGNPPAAWLPRDGEHVRRVRLPAGGDVELALSYEAVDAVLCLGARPWAPWPYALTAHFARPPDMIAMNGRAHEVPRNAMVAAIGRNRTLAAQVAEDARKLAAVDFDGPFDIVAGYVGPLIGAGMRSLGLPVDTWAPALSGQFVRSAADKEPMEAEWKALESWCRQARDQRQPQDLLSRMDALMLANGATRQQCVHAWRVMRTGGPTAGEPLVGILATLLDPAWAWLLEIYLAGDAVIRKQIVSELVRVRWNFGLMNPRTVTRRLELSDGTTIGPGHVVCSMRAALLDERFWGKGAADVDPERPVSTKAWSWEDHGCPNYRMGWAQVADGTDAWVSAHPYARLVRQPRMLPGLCPAPGEVLIAEPSRTSPDGHGRSSSTSMAPRRCAGRPSVKRHGRAGTTTP